LNSRKIKKSEAELRSFGKKNEKIKKKKLQGSGIEQSQNEKK
jgi:hypothetical protein